MSWCSNQGTIIRNSLKCQRKENQNGMSKKEISEILVLLIESFMKSLFVKKKIKFY